jgi:electron transfer flavoprotein alpha subunit
MPAILVFVEHADGVPKKASLEALGAAVRLGAALGAPVAACTAGPGAAAAAAAAAGRGAARVLAMDVPALATFTAAGWGRAVAAAARAADATLVLLGATARGRDLAPAVAARLSLPVVADAVAAEVEGGRVAWTRPVYAGKALLRVAAAGGAVASLRPNAFPAAAPSAAGSVEALDPGVPPGDLRVVVKEVVAASVRRVDLTEADIVVSGGRGLKGPENFHVVEALAAALGGVVGASRAVVDAGWRPHGEQVGQTGKTVSPRLYVALGISGAIQHLAGMSSSRCIVAVNRDPDAPIFKVADYGIVGDALEVAPALTAAILRAKGG